MSEWLTAEEVCHYLKLGRRTLYRYVEEGKLPAYRVGDTGTLRFRKEDVDAFLRPLEMKKRPPEDNP